MGIMVNMSDQPAPVDFSGGNLSNTIECTNNVQTAGYHPTGENLAGHNGWAEGSTNPTELMNGLMNSGNTESNPLSNMNGGGKRKKRSRKLKRSNKSRLNSKSKKSRS